MHTDAGTTLTVPTAAHRAANAPASSTRQRAVGRSLTEPRDSIMRVAALQEAETYLGDVCATWYLLSLDDCAIAIKHALGWLTVIALASPTRAAIWYRELALAAGVSKTELRREIENRADFWRNFNDFANKRRDETEGALCTLLF